MKKKKLMILGASILQLPAIEKARSMGLDVVVADYNPDAVGFNVEGVMKEVISTIDVPAVVEAAKRHKIDGIMTLATDLPMRSVAAVAKELGLIGISEDTALKATNKAVMRQALADHGVPIPRFYRAEDKRQFDEIVEKFKVPFMVKPTDNSGSRGVVLVEDPSDRKAADEAYAYSSKQARSGVVVVEEYMRGPEVSVETLTVDGEFHLIQITDKLTTGAPHFVELGHSQPTKLPPETVKRIYDVAKAANEAIGIAFGPSHTEIIVTDEGPKIVELGARLGGDCITSHLVPLSTGVDMVECCIRIALGEKPDVTPKFSRGSAIRYFHQTPGVIKSFSTCGAENMKGIKQVSFVKNIGDTVTDIDSSSARIGFVIACDDTADLAVADCEAALDTVNTVIEKE